MTESVNPPFFDDPNRVKHAALAVLALVAVASLGLLVVAVAWPDRATAALRWWLLAIGTAVLLAADRLAVTIHPVHGRTAFDAIQKRRAVTPQSPERLRQLERFVSSARLDRLELRGRLRPVLYEIAVQRFSAYRGVDIAVRPDVARATLGDRFWALLTTPATAPDREGPGVELSELRALIDALEKLDDCGDAHD